MNLRHRKVAAAVAAAAVAPLTFAGVANAQNPSTTPPSQVSPFTPEELQTLTQNAEKSFERLFKLLFSSGESRRTDLNAGYVFVPISNTFKSTKTPAQFTLLGFLAKFDQQVTASFKNAKATVNGAQAAKTSKLTFATQRRTLKAGQTFALKLKLSKKQRALLNKNRNKSIKVPVTLTFRDSAGLSAGSYKKTVTVKLKKAKKKK